MSSEISWKIVAPLDVDALTPEDASGKFFNPSVNTGLYRQLGLALKHSYVPISLRPNTAYDDRIRKLAKGKGYAFKEIKLPYTIEVEGLGPARLTMRFRFFPPNIASLTARLKGLDRGLADVPFDTLFNCRIPGQISRLQDVITWSLGLLTSKPTEQVNPHLSSRTYFGFHFSDVASAAKMPNYWRDSQQRLVGLLIGVPTYQEMKSEIVEAVVGKCEGLNYKSVIEHLLVNKQGAIYVSPSGQPHSYVYKQKYAHAMNLAEIGMVLRAFLDHTYPERRKGQELFLDYIYRIVRAWLGQPEAVLDISYTHGVLWKLLTSEFGLTDKRALLESDNPWVTREIDKSSEFFAKSATNWWASPSYAATFLQKDSS